MNIKKINKFGKNAFNVTVSTIVGAQVAVLSTNFLNGAYSENQSTDVDEFKDNVTLGMGAGALAAVGTSKAVDRGWEAAANLINEKIKHAQVIYN